MADGETRGATIHDVAALVGVSTAAVSLALNGRAGVSDRTRRRVLAAAAQLNFRPNRLAKSLRTGRSSILAFLTPDIANPFYTELAQGVISAAAASEQHVLVAQTGRHVSRLEREVEALLDHQCGGFVFTAVTEADRPVLDRLLALGVPFVQLIRRLDELPADYVGSDEEAGGATVAEHLLRLGHRDVAVVAGPSVSSASRARLEGLTRRLAEDGVAVPAHRLAHGELSHDDGYDATRELLGRADVVPTALVCGNDLMALGAIDALLDEGLRVPDDVSVIGYDDMSFASARQIGLTTIHQPQAAMGEEAVRVLLSRLAGSDAAPAEVLLPHHLVVRTSTSPPSRPHPAGA